MKHSKRWISLLLAGAMALSLTACGTSSEGDAPSTSGETDADTTTADSSATADTTIWEKGYKENNGIPLFVDDEEDLAAKPNAVTDSWYVISNFECDGKQLGFMWHQQINTLGPDQKIQTIEFLQMDAEENVWSNNSFAEPISETSGADADRLHVYSSIGELSGDSSQMTLKLEVENGSLDVTLTPRDDILYNGTTGLLYFLGGQDSYEFAYPNMDITGTFTLDGTEYTIENATAWFDRQWGAEYDPEAAASEESTTNAWLWLGMPLGEDSECAISLWDSYNSRDGRYAFATILREDRTQINVKADVTYSRIWQSEHTGNQYPYDVHISIPEEELELTLTSLIDEPEFYREGNPISGCQSFCKVTGTYRGETIDRYAILEMVGDLGSNI